MLVTRIEYVERGGFHDFQPVKHFRPVATLNAHQFERAFDLTVIQPVKYRAVLGHSFEPLVFKIEKHPDGECIFRPDARRLILRRIDLVGEAKRL